VKAKGRSTTRLQSLFISVLLGSTVPLVPIAAAPSPGLVLEAADFRIEQRGDSGYHLFIRQKPGLASVLLVESTSDPAMKADSFAYRDPDYHRWNGDEKRLLNGKFLPAGKGNYWLIDSTPEDDKELGKAFHIFIPWVVDWGYSWSRSGKTFIADGTFVNVRTFSKAYADYTGPWLDNPFLVRVTQKPLPRPFIKPPESTVPPSPPPPEPPPPAEEPKPDLSLYQPDAVKSFTEIAQAGKGELRFSDGRDDILPKLKSLLDKPTGRTLDLLFCVDSTDSMADDIAAVKKTIPTMLAEELKPYDGYRVALLLYKDYFEDFLVKRYEWTSDLTVFGSELEAVRVNGGRDIPEAVYEALYSGLTDYAWIAEDRKIILIGDAPPHPIPRGKVDESMVTAAALDRKVALDVIILPP